LKLSKAKITSPFVRLDTRVNAADAFANVYTQQQLRLNHNMLLARRARRPIITMGASQWGVYSIYPADSASAVSLFSAPFVLSHNQIRDLQVNFYTGVDDNYGSTADVDVFGIITAPDEVRTVDVDNTVSATVTTTPGWEAITVPVSNAARRALAGRVTLVIDGSTGATSGSAVSVSDAGPDWVEAQFGTVAEGFAVYSPTSTDIQARQIVRVESNVDAAGNDRVTVWPRWNRKPNPGTDTVQLRIAAGSLYASHISVYEVNPTGFYTESSNFVT
jgi:hypothetical protein